ncbi:sarcolemmal membrane-associated protein-like [Rhopilema esculentum]|uniref:sarcolemmal membrane-associated protein-like n=1 Tax=Rhopilema esculentum TaxID=499914 RepID=UPI0031DE6037
MAYAILGARPNSHPFQERKVILKEPVKIGRAVAKCKSAQNNLIFDCKVLSRSHAIIWYESGKFYIQDTKSSNGTYVNNAQVGRGADDAESVEIRSGDVLQFGVDVVENSKKVTHGCIIALVTLINPDGTEALGEPDKPTGRVLPFVNGDHNLRTQELWQLSKYLQDAMNREQLLEQKLATMQRMIANSSVSSDETFQAFVKEDELLSRLDILENELDIITKEMPEEDCRKLLLSSQEEKENYEMKAKETIQRLIEEKSETLQKLTDVQRSLSYSEDECTHFKSLYEKSEDDIKNLMDHNEQLAQEVHQYRQEIDSIKASSKSYETKAIEEQQQLKRDVEDAEKRASTLAVQIESLQAECDFTKEQLSAMKEKLEKRQADLSGPSSEKSTDTSEERIAGAAEQTQLLENLQESLVETKHYIRKLASESIKDRDLPDFDDGLLEVEENRESRCSLEFCSKFAKGINGDLAVLSRCFDNLRRDEEENLLDRLNSAQSEVSQVQAQIELLNENLANEQATSQKYKELAMEFEDRLKELQERFQDKETVDGREDKESVSQSEQDEVQFNKKMGSVVEEQMMLSSVNKTPNQEDNFEQVQSEAHQSKDGSPIGQGQGKIKFIEELDMTRTQKNQLLYMLVALVVLFVAVGAAWMLGVIHVSTGRIFDWKTWREFYEQLF